MRCRPDSIGGCSRAQKPNSQIRRGESQRFVRYQIRRGESQGFVRHQTRRGESPDSPGMLTPMLRRHQTIAFANSIHFVTLVTRERGRWFVAPELCREILTTFERCRAKENLECFGYVLMPDHLHALLRQCDEARAGFQEIHFALFETEFLSGYYALAHALR